MEVVCIYKNYLNWFYLFHYILKKCYTNYIPSLAKQNNVAAKHRVY